MNKRERMRASNKMVRQHLLDNDYDEIWFKAHTKKLDYTFSQKGTYQSMDLWNLFDGICISSTGIINFLQIKTTNWAREEPIRNFLKKVHGVNVLVFRVTKSLKECKGHYKIFKRLYH